MTRAHAKNIAIIKLLIFSKKRDQQCGAWHFKKDVQNGENNFVWENARVYRFCVISRNYRSITSYLIATISN